MKTLSAFSSVQNFAFLQHIFAPYFFYQIVYYTTFTWLVKAKLNC
jgi:hypothetical protein